MRLVALALALFSGFSAAQEYETSVGFGHQYGGALGAKLAYTTDSTKVFGSIGLIGAAAGFQSVLGEDTRHAFGMVVGSEVSHSEDGFFFVTYDYHFDGFMQKGWLLGTGVGVTRQDESGSFGDTGDVETSMAMTLTLAYKF